MAKFQYYAFISYSRRDEKTAVWLQNRLELFTVPKEIVDQRGGSVPKHIRPVFRDKTDIGTGNLSKNLQRELDDSRYLIVVCSPASAQSHWVNEEVAYFQSIGRADYIIPFIISGTPTATEVESRCYPPPLSTDILGVSLPELGKEQSLIKVVSTILGLKYDELYQRHKRREKKKRRLIVGVSTLVFLLIACLSIYYWDYNRVKIKYFTDYVEEWGVPQGILELKTAEIAQRSFHYRFEYRQRQLQKVVQANSADWPIIHPHLEFVDRPLIQEFHYNEHSGILDFTNHLSVSGKTVLRKEYSGKELSVIDFTHGDRLGTAKTLDAHSTSMNSGVMGFQQSRTQASDIGRYELVRDEKGRVQQVLFRRDNRNTPVRDAEGVYGYSFERDDLGRVTRKTYLDQDGNHWGNKIGNAGVRYYYDEAGNQYKTEHLNAQGELIINEIGYAYGITEFDEDGRSVAGSYYGASGEPVIVTGQAYAGYSSLTAVHDDRGNMIELAFFNDQGEPCFETFGGAAMYRSTYDARGLVAGMVACDGEGNPINGKAGFSSYHVAYDEYANPIIQSYRDLSGSPARTNIGVAYWRNIFNTDGTLSEAQALGADSLPTIALDSYRSKITYEYDQYGNMLKESYYGVDGLPCLSKVGTSATYWKYDEQGNVSELGYFGIDGKLTLDQEALIARQTYQRDERGYIIATRNFGADDKPCLNNEGLHAWLEEYDEFGNVLKVTYLGLEDEPTLALQSLVAGLVNEHDRNGNVTETRYFDQYGKLANSKDQYAIGRANYDTYGRQIMEAYFDEKGKPCIAKPGYVHQIRYAYDEGGNITQMTAHGLDGERSLGRSRGAMFCYRYNDLNQRIEEIFLDTDSLPTVIDRGYAVIKRTLDGYGNILSEAYFDAKGEPVLNEQSIAKWVATYNNFGQSTTISYFGRNGEACLLKVPGVNSGIIPNYHEIQYKYDQYGRLVQELRYDENGKLTVLASGGPGIAYEYDEFNRLRRTIYLGVGLKLRNSKGTGYAVEENEYDERGQIIKKSYFDRDGKACFGENTYSVEELEYDLLGRVTRRKTWMPDGSDAFVDGTTEQRFTYNHAGNMTDWFLFGADGRPAIYNSQFADDSGFAHLSITYDARQNSTEKHFFDINEKPINTKKRYARIKYTYDARDNQIRTEYYTSSGQRSDTEMGFSSFTDEYDERDRLVVRKYFLSNNQPIAGAHAIHYRYNEFDQKVAEQPLDAQGQLVEQMFLICIGEVYSGLAGDEYGLLPWDFILEWGDWFHDHTAPGDEIINGFATALRAMEDQLKPITIVRANELNELKVLTFELPAGKIGCRIVDMTLPAPTASEILNFYQKWRIKQSGN